MTMGIKLKQEVLTGYKEKHFHHEDSQALEQVAQRGYTISIHGGFMTRMNKALNNVV